MTITTNASAPLFAVVGSTGIQGTSVIKAIEASTTAYRVRGLTRDTSKPNAQALTARGVEVVTADTSKTENLEKAFAGATFVFALTTPISGDEYNHGKNQLDAAKAVGVKTVVWSGLSSLSAFTDGKYPCLPFDEKAKVTAYARTIATPSFRVIDVQAPGYLSNYLNGTRPIKTEDGTFLLALPQTTDSVGPVADVDEDFGEYALGAIERGAGDLETVYAAPEYTTRDYHAALFSKVFGKQVTAVELSKDEFIKNVEGAFVKAFAETFYNGYQAVQIAGYWNGADLTASNAVLRRPARTFEEGVVANKDEFAALFQ